MADLMLPDKIITSKIYLIRNEKVMLDYDLAELYSVETKNLNRGVKRNINRFPEDFMFQLTKQEVKNLRFQIGTSSWGGQRYLPYAFTEQGVAMLSSILNSDRAIAVKIQIIRMFTRMRQFIITQKDILLKLEKLEKGSENHDEKIKLIFEYLKELLTKPAEPRKQIGFKQNKNK